jgi:cob(I)alamin adenosyltransferase
MAAIGEVDEANCAIGLAIAALPSGELADRLRAIQNEMFDLGADLATPFGTEFEQHALRIVARQVERLEEEIDAMNTSLEPLEQLYPSRWLNRRSASSSCPGRYPQG